MNGISHSLPGTHVAQMHKYTRTEDVGKWYLVNRKVSLNSKTDNFGLLEALGGLKITLLFVFHWFQAFKRQVTGCEIHLRMHT